jgi:hypothetical protein
MVEALETLRPSAHEVTRNPALESPSAAISRIEGSSSTNSTRSSTGEA